MGDRGPTPLVKGRWPKARGIGTSEYGHEVSILSRPRRRFGYFAAVGKVTRRPQTAESPRGIISYTKQTTEKRLFEIKEKSNK